MRDSCGSAQPANAASELDHHRLTCEKPCPPPAASAFLTPADWGPSSAFEKDASIWDCRLNADTVRMALVASVAMWPASSSALAAPIEKPLNALPCRQGR